MTEEDRRRQALKIAYSKAHTPTSRLAQAFRHAKKLKDHLINNPTVAATNNTPQTKQYKSNRIIQNKQIESNKSQQKTTKTQAKYNQQWKTIPNKTKQTEIGRAENKHALAFLSTD